MMFENFGARGCADSDCEALNGDERSATGTSTLSSCEGSCKNGYLILREKIIKMHFAVQILVV